MNCSTAVKLRKMWTKGSSLTTVTQPKFKRQSMKLYPKELRVESKQSTWKRFRLKMKSKALQARICQNYVNQNY